MGRILKRIYSFLPYRRTQSIGTTSTGEPSLRVNRPIFVQRFFLVSRLYSCGADWTSLLVNRVAGVEKLPHWGALHKLAAFVPFTQLFFCLACLFSPFFVTCVHFPEAL